MSRSKKPVVIVAMLLVALIVVPLVLLVTTRSSGSGAGAYDDSVPTGANSGTVTADFDLRQLVERAEKLLQEDLAKAVRAGDVSLDFISALQSDATMGKEAMQRGRTERAAELYTGVVQAGEARLAELAIAERARALSQSVYAELQRLEHLKGVFENTYTEAVESYNGGLRALNAGEYPTSVDAFEMASAIIGDLEARSIQQVGAFLEAGDDALAAYQLETARSAYGQVLDLDKGNTAAAAGLETVNALEGIAEEVKSIRALEADGKLVAALAELEALNEKHPNNAFIEKQRASIEARIAERKYEALVATSIEAEKAGDFAGAVSALEAALEIKSTAEQAERLKGLREQYKAKRLELLLADGFEALKSGRFESARNFYKEAVALAPESKEARTGLEKASSLYLASLRYTQNIEGAARLIGEGRYPLAAKLFNEAMASRPTNLVPSKIAEETRIRSILETQSEEVTVTIESDRRTYVSIIGVLPPNRFRNKELNLFPDVYKVRGTRSGYEPVEIDLKVDANQANKTITVECTEKL